MGLLGRFKWRKVREALIMTGKTAKEFLPDNTDGAVNLLMSATPADQDFYRPYLAYLGKRTLIPFRYRYRSFQAINALFNKCFFSVKNTEMVSL